MRGLLGKWLGMIGLLALLVVPAMPAPAAASAPAGNPPEFTDVHITDWFYAPVMGLVDEGVIAGYADGTFRPYGFTTRAQFAKVVVLAEKLPITTTGGPHFVDVPLGHPFYDVIETAYFNGLITGYADGTFRPNANVTRGQLAKILVHACRWQPVVATAPHFLDVPPASPYFVEVETIYMKGLMNGYDDQMFRVNGYATRAQVAKVVFGAEQMPPDLSK